MRCAAAVTIAWLLQGLVNLAALVPHGDYNSVVMIIVPPGRQVIVERRKTDLSRNLPITVNRTDTVIVNGVVQ